MVADGQAQVGDGDEDGQAVLGHQQAYQTCLGVTVSIATLLAEDSIYYILSFYRNFVGIFLLADRIPGTRKWRKMIGKQ